tara:strand:- start:576 stop:689 length:114 start_codon:yes stop_codon:yes gene_type:complete
MIIAESSKTLLARVDLLSEKLFFMALTSNKQFYGETW